MQRGGLGWVLVVGALLAPASANPTKTAKHRLGFTYEVISAMPPRAGIPKDRVVVFSDPAKAPAGVATPVQRVRFVVQLRDPADDKIVVGGDPDWVSVAARDYSEVHGGKLVPHIHGTACDEDDANASCASGPAEYLAFRRNGWETQGAMFAIVRQGEAKRFLIVGYVAKLPGEEAEATQQRAKQLAYSIRVPANS
jgi:hypothetical protein